MYGPQMIPAVHLDSVGPSGDTCGTPGESVQGPQSERKAFWVLGAFLG